jgi:DNA-binding NtrC family response regulator
MRLLIIGSLGGQIGAASKIAMARGATVSQANDIDAALQGLRAGRGADVSMIDVGLDIRDLVQRLKAERINLPVIACGVGADKDLAVQAIKAGAKEYIPLPPQAELIAAILEAVTEESHQLIFRDPSMAKLIKLAEQVAPANASLLITGESGTGKEVLARYVHAKSLRSDKPFVSVNCAAIPDMLLESDLFGHEKGAFTGAVARRIGKFEEANGGTLLLDEISEMDVRLQAKLLRAIQEREIDRIGGGRPVKIDIRLIATSNRDLAADAKKGRFREDLLFRLNVLNLKLPPLRERPGDIQVLAEHYARKYADANGVEPRPLSPAAIAVLMACPWTGNVRELENTLHRAVLLAVGPEIDAEAIRLPDGSRTGGESPVPGEPAGATAAQVRLLVGRTVAEVERELIIDTLAHCLGNRTHAANVLGISIRTLRNKLKQYSSAGAAVPAPGEAQRIAL